MSLLDSTTVILSNPYEAVNATDSFSVAQGLYAQTSVPNVGAGNVVTFGIVSDAAGTIPGPDYTMSFTNSSGLKWFFGGSLAGAPSGQYGTYTAGDVFAVYANPQEVVFTQNANVIQKYPSENTRNVLPPLGSSYKLFLLLAYVQTSGTLTFPKTMFYPAGSRGSQGQTFTTLQVRSGSSSIVTPTAFTLTASGDEMTTQESLAAIQGIYLQTRLPELQNIGDSVTIGFKGPTGTADFYLVYTKDTNVGPEVDTDYTISLVAYGGSPQPIGYSGRTYAGNVWSLYLDHKVLIVSLNGTPFSLAGGGYVTNYDPQYQYSATYSTSSSTNPVNFIDVMFYPTGSPGKDGASTVTFNAYPNNYRVLTPNSVRLVTSGTNNTFTNESFNGDTSGIYCQFLVPQITGEGESITVLIQDVSTTYNYYGIQFDMNGYTCVSSTGFVSNGDYTTTAYNGFIFSIYSDGTTVYFYSNGVEKASATYGSGIYLMNINGVGTIVNNADPGVLYFLNPYDITNILMYPTGKKGGASTTPSYACFSSSETQFPDMVNASKPIQLYDVSSYYPQTATTDIVLSTDNWNTITFTNPGDYLVNWRAKVRATDEGIHTIWLWIRNNATDLTHTSVATTIDANVAVSYSLVSASSVITIATTGDTIQFMWQSNNANDLIEISDDRALGPFGYAVPAYITPSFSCTISKVG